MADLSSDIRLAVDSGEVVFGLRSVLKSIKENTTKLIIATSKNKEQNLLEIKHLASISNTRIITFEGNPIALGALCGKPFSVSMLSIIKPGNSRILETSNKESKIEAEPEEINTEEISLEKGE
ncbi:50S ribosomal protein L30e [Candidatus Marsarchaeota archaeon]|jgi:large subunit ribosomal protein L30e|nr:50S ribosomal protein L30e [Candidatus Marsarchaeota archaeon]MCL5089743.1 50S ribosomal protein L30e [Candidatus Marsarchaeota archaeon]